MPRSPPAGSRRTPDCRYPSPHPGPAPASYRSPPRPWPACPAAPPRGTRARCARTAPHAPRAESAWLETAAACSSRTASPPTQTQGHLPPQVVRAALDRLLVRHPVVALQQKPDAKLRRRHTRTSEVLPVQPYEVLVPEPL